MLTKSSSTTSDIIGYCFNKKCRKAIEADIRQRLVSAKLASKLDATKTGPWICLKCREVKGLLALARVSMFTKFGWK